MSEEIKKAILIKLMRKRMWLHKHTSFDNLPKGFPSHLTKEVKKVAEDLIRDGVLLKHPTSYGIEVSLNPKMKQKIEEIAFG